MSLEEQVVLVHELRRLVLTSPQHLGGWINVLDVETFKALMEAINCTNSSASKILHSMEQLLRACEASDALVEPLISLCKSTTERDICMQVGLAGILYSRTFSAQLLRFMVSRLEKLQTGNLSRFSGILRNLKVERGRMSSDAATLPFSPGIIMLAACWDLDLNVLEKGSLWISENAATVDSVVVKAFAKCLESSTVENIRKFLVPVINKMLLRSSGSALIILVDLSLPEEVLFNDLFDGIWTQLSSENDENRTNASKILSCTKRRAGSQVNHLGKIVEKIEATFGGKSVKAKKAFLFLLYKVVGPADSTTTETILRRLLAKETSEEIVYWLVVCLRACGCTGLFEEGLKQPKASLKASYIAGVCGEAFSEKQVAELVSKKDIDQLLIVLATIDTTKPTMAVVKAGLLNGFLSVAAINENLNRYPLIPIWKIIKLFSVIDGDLDACSVLWKNLISIWMQHPHLARQFVSTISKTTLSIKALTDCCQQEAENPTTLSKLIINAVKSEGDLLEAVEIANTIPFKSVCLWETLIRRVKGQKLEPLSGSIILKKLLVVKCANAQEAIIKAFPQVAEPFSAYLVEVMSRLAREAPNEEELMILNTPDDKLPVIDVVTPIRKQLEALAKKDPTKKPPTTGMSKAEMTALEAEISREKGIKAKFNESLHQLENLTAIIRSFANVCPRMLEPSLGSLSDCIFTTGKWLEKDLSKFYYQIARCCSRPIGKYGPLLASTWYSLSNPALIDINWNIPNRSDLYGALVRHLEEEKLTGSSWLFIMPVVVKLLHHAAGGDVDDLIVNTLLTILARNAEIGVSWKSLAEFFTVLCKLSGSMPGVFAAINSAISALVNSATIQASDINAFILVKMMQSSSDFERRFGLSLLESLAGRFKESLVATSELRLWIAILCCDPTVAPKAQRLAEILYGETELSVAEWKELVKIAINADFDGCIAVSSCKALVRSLENNPTVEIFSFLEATYRQLFAGRLPEMNQVRAPKLDLTSVARERVAMIYSSLAKALESGTLIKSSFFNVIPTTIQFFLIEAFFDPKETVHDELLNAAGLLVVSGLDDKATVESVAQVCDTFLSSKGKSDEEFDRVRVYGVILLAKVADRFHVDDPRRLKLLDSLYSTLNTPSESVQNAVADAMVCLFPTLSDSVAGEYLEKFLTLLGGPSMAVRRGSAFGLGALVRGRGSRMLKEHSILNRLCATLQDKSSTVETKQGALFGLELIARYLGRSFEPYIVKLLDTLIATFADGRTEVREASLEAAQAMMATVSSLGARLLLPVLLEQMASTSWRSKVGAIEWLGAMASLAPRVLAKQLPLILPKLIESLTDSHHQIQRAARDALYRYGAVVRNPEIRALSAVIMEALSNPPEATEKCLGAILHTAFAHVVDGPSLALLEPVLVRALRDRGTEIKKKAAQIIGNLATNLVDSRDLEGVLNGLVPALLSCLSDPVPDVRSHCGKVLGILVKTVGERPLAMKSLADDLLSIIANPHATSVDRAGAAQALAEILAARGAAMIVDLLTGPVLAGLTSNRVASREGFIMLLGYLPAAFEGELPELYEIGLRSLIGPSLGLLADENEAVREAANTACHCIIAGCARIDHVAIFDVLVETLSDARWRCRLGCLQLFMEFLSKFSSGESDTSMGIFSMPSVEELSAGGIDEARIRGLMSRAFIYRFDNNSSAIRHHALTIWKGLAAHPLRAISSILPVFIEECCEMVESDEGREVIFKALDDMLGKIGDRLLFNLLERCLLLAEGEGEYRVGALYVATVAAKLLGTGSFPGITNSLLDSCIPKFIEMLQLGLGAVDIPSTTQACRLFVSIVDSGDRVGVHGLVERIVGPMLEELLGDPVVDPVTLDGLVDLLKSDETGKVFDITMSALLAKDTPLKNEELASAVCEVVAAVFEAVGSEGASKTVPILRTIINAGVIPVEGKVFHDTCASILAALEADYDSSYQVSLSQLLETVYSDNPKISFTIVKIYCSVPDASLTRFYDIWPRRILSSSDSSDLVAFLETVSPEGIYSLASSINDALAESTKIENKDLVGLMVKNLIVPLLVQTTTMAYYEEDCRNLACRLSSRLSSNVVATTWGSALTSLIGALIRTASDKNTTSNYVFEALASNVIAQTKLVRPFHPQLQRIFSNALGVESVRAVSTKALISLLPALARPEALISDLFTMAEHGPTELRLSALEILCEAKSCGDSARVLEVAQACLADDHAGIRESGAKWIKSIMMVDELEPHRSALESLLALN